MCIRDRVYLPIADREASLLGIRSALGRIAQGIRKAIPGSAVTKNATSDGTRIVVRHRSAQIKIEVTPVLRGTVHPVELRTVRPAAEERFGFAEIQVVSLDVYKRQVLKLPLQLLQRNNLRGRAGGNSEDLAEQSGTPYRCLLYTSR